MPTVRPVIRRHPFRIGEWLFIVHRPPHATYIRVGRIVIHRTTEWNYLRLKPNVKQRYEGR